MVKPHLSLLVCAYLAAATAAFAQTSYVFQLPGLAQTGQAPQIEGVGDNNFGRILGPINSTSFSGATKVVATPTGSKFYILTSGGILSANSTLTAASPISAIAGTVSDAVISPDGKYLFVIASHLYIVNTQTDAVAVDADTGVPSGNTPVAVAVSHDARTAWVLSNATTGSTITAVDLTVLQASPGQLSLLSGATSMVLSPGNLLYVTSGANKLFEIDPLTLTVTPLGQISVPGLAGPLQFTPDGSAAYFVNQTVCGTCSPIFKLAVQTHAISTWLPSDNSAPPSVDQMLVAGNNRVFALSTPTRTLYDVTPAPFALSPTTIGQLPTGTVVAAAVSNENPSSRFLYLLFTDHNFVRVNLGSNGVDQQTTLDPVNGQILSFVPIPAQSGASSLQLINVSQTLAPSATAVLIGQVLDPVGRPVMGANASFSADIASGIAITNPTVVTTAGGWAQTTVTAPTVAGNYTVALTSGILQGSFLLNVNSTGSSGNTGGNGAPQMLIYSGDGQLLQQNNPTSQPLTVKIVDATGNPLPNVAVTFQVASGFGSVTSLNQGVTDASGLAKATYASANLVNGQTVLLSKVDATSVYGTVEFFEVTQDALFLGTRPPNSTIVTPAASRSITVPQGGLLPAGIAVFTFANDTGLPIPNVGLRLVDPTNISANSTVASCQGLSRGDSQGISRCNVLAACQPTFSLPHTFGVFLSVGEYQQFSLTITVTAGTASVLTPVSALNQNGSPGSSFTLTAQVSDGCGQPISTGGLNWGVLQGSAPATLSQVQSSSDAGGSVSARVTLGQTAGVVQVQLSGAGLTPVIFKITNQISISGISVVTPLPAAVTIGQQFQPLTFVVRDSTNNPVQGVLVNFSVSGSATLNPGSATTNALGQVQTTVTAGNIAGNIVVTASAGGLTATATVSSNAAGPQLITTSFSNAASGAVGMTPCGLVTVSGSGISPGITGVVNAANFFGAWPYALAGVSITVNNIPVPIQSVANDQFGQHATFQAPCELTGSSATVVVTVNGAKTTVTNVLVFAVQPGSFTSLGPNNKLYGAFIREVDGTYITAGNPAKQGDKLYAVVTGLGQVTPALITNSIGTGPQTVNVPMLVFLNNRALGALSARAMFGSIGSYLVEFQVPADAATGFDQSLVVIALVNNQQDFLPGNTVLVPAVSVGP